MKRVAGVALIAPLDDGRKAILLGKRSQGVDHPGTWSIPGGEIDAGEDLHAAALRELQEETGRSWETSAMRPACSRRVDQIVHSTMVAEVARPEAVSPEGFEHAWETDAFQWVPVDELDTVEPLHPGLADTLDDVRAAVENPHMFEYDADGQAWLLGVHYTSADFDRPKVFHAYHSQQHGTRYGAGFYLAPKPLEAQYAHYGRANDLSGSYKWDCRLRVDPSPTGMLHWDRPPPDELVDAVRATTGLSTRALDVSSGAGLYDSLCNRLKGTQGANDALLAVGCRGVMSDFCYAAFDPEADLDWSRTRKETVQEPPTPEQGLERVLIGVQERFRAGAQALAGLFPDQAGDVAAPAADPSAPPLARAIAHGRRAESAVAQASSRVEQLNAAAGGRDARRPDVRGLARALSGDLDPKTAEQAAKAAIAARQRRYSDPDYVAWSQMASSACTGQAPANSGKSTAAALSVATSMDPDGRLRKRFEAQASRRGFAQALRWLETSPDLARSDYGGNGTGSRLRDFADQVRSACGAEDLLDAGRALFRRAPVETVKMRRVLQRDQNDRLLNDHGADIAKLERSWRAEHGDAEAARRFTQIACGTFDLDLHADAARAIRAHGESANGEENGRQAAVRAADRDVQIFAQGDRIVSTARRTFLDGAKVLSDLSHSPEMAAETVADMMRTKGRQGEPDPTVYGAISEAARAAFADRGAGVRVADDGAVDWRSGSARDVGGAPDRMEWTESKDGRVETARFQVGRGTYDAIFRREPDGSVYRDCRPAYVKGWPQGAEKIPDQDPRVQRALTEITLGYAETRRPEGLQWIASTSLAREATRRELAQSRKRYADLGYHVSGADGRYSARPDERVKAADAVAHSTPSRRYRDADAAAL